MFHEIMIDLREYRLRRRRLKWSRLYIDMALEIYTQIFQELWHQNKDM